MDVPNLKYIKDINDPPSPKMKRLFMGLTGKRFEPDIRVKGGAGLAIATVVNVLQAGLAKRMVGGVVLPAECFCYEFSETTGKGLMSKLVDDKYRDGYAVAMLGRAAKEFNRASLVAGRKRHVGKVLKVRRTASLSLEAPKLPELTQVKRGFGR